jgi:hypothetical protein
MAEEDLELLITLDDPWDGHEDTFNHLQTVDCSVFGSKLDRTTNRSANVPQLCASLFSFKKRSLRDPQRSRTQSHYFRFAM